MKRVFRDISLSIFILSIPICAVFTYEALIPRVADSEANIRLLPDTVNSPFVDYAPWINDQNDLLFFESNRPLGVGETGDFDIWVSTRQSGMDGRLGDFDNALNLGKPVNSSQFEGFPVLRKNSSEEWEIIFAAEPRPGSGDPEGMNIYTARQLNGVWQEPEAIIELNTDFQDRMPAISPDGKYLFFSSNRPGGFGQDDLYMAEYSPEERIWKNLQNMGSQFNGPQSEIAPTVHKDGVTFFFSSDRPGGVGGQDLYFSQIADKDEKPIRFKVPQNMGTPFNSEQDDEYVATVINSDTFYFSSNRAGGYGNFDIYQADMPEYAKTRVIITYQGRVFDKDTGKGIEANIQAISQNRQQNLATQLPSGSYLLSFLNDQVIQVTVSAPGYLPYEAFLDLRDLHKKQNIERNFPLTRQQRLPDSYTLDFEFVHSSTGEVLKPMITYRLLPDSIQDTILPQTNNRFQLKIAAGSRFSQVVTFEEYLKRSKINLQASMPGFKDLNYSRTLRQIIDPRILDMPKAIKITLPMLPDIKDNDIVQIIEPARNNQVATVMFPYDVSDMLVSGSMDSLNKVVDLWTNKGKPILILHGHTDSSGTPEYNLELSRKRALFIRDQLEIRGIPSEKMKTSWYGATKPVSNEQTDTGKAKNRRVEIFLPAEE